MPVLFGDITADTGTPFETIDTGQTCGTVNRYPSLFVMGRTLDPASERHRDVKLVIPALLRH